MLLACADVSGRLHQPHDHIHLIESAFCYIDHVLAQFIFCLVDTWSVQENDLAPLIGIHRLDAVSCGLRFLGCDRDLLADQMVHQSRFPHIWTADQRYKSRFKILIHTFLSFILKTAPCRTATLTAVPSYHRFLYL